MEIKRLPEDVSTALKTSATLHSIPHCVNELAYNSLDAMSTSVAVRVNLQNFRIQVVDNGQGISRSNLEQIGENNMTNKCNSLKDFKSSLKTYGFKGTCLFSLKNQVKSMSMVTRFKNEEVTLKKTFQTDGIDEITEIKHRPSVGTTITLENVFFNMPVRQRYVQAKIDFESMKRSLECLSIIHPNVAFTLRNDANRKMIFKNVKTKTVAEAIVNLHPGILHSDLKQVKVCKGRMVVTGLISKSTIAHNKCQFIFCNKRLVTNSCLQKHIETILSNSSMITGENKKAYLAFVMNIKAPYADFEMSITDEKVDVVFKDLDVVLKCVEKLLDTFCDKECIVRNKIDEGVCEVKVDEAEAVPFKLTDITGTKRFTALRKEVEVNEQVSGVGNIEEDMEGDNELGGCAEKGNKVIEADALKSNRNKKKKAKKMKNGIRCKTILAGNKSDGLNYKKVGRHKNSDFCELSKPAKQKVNKVDTDETGKSIIKDVYSPIMNSFVGDCEEEITKPSKILSHKETQNNFENVKRKQMKHSNNKKKNKNWVRNYEHLKKLILQGNEVFKNSFKFKTNDKKNNELSETVVNCKAQLEEKMANFDTAKFLKLKNNGAKDSVPKSVFSANNEEIGKALIMEKFLQPQVSPGKVDSFASESLVRKSKTVKSIKSKISIAQTKFCQSTVIDGKKISKVIETNTVENFVDFNEVCNLTFERDFVGIARCDTLFEETHGNDSDNNFLVHNRRVQIEKQQNVKNIVEIGNVEFLKRRSKQAFLELSPWGESKSKNSNKLLKAEPLFIGRNVNCEPNFDSSQIYSNADEPDLIGDDDPIAQNTKELLGKRCLRTDGYRTQNVFKIPKSTLKTKRVKQSSRNERNNNKNKYGKFPVRVSLSRKSVLSVKTTRIRSTFNSHPFYHDKILKSNLKNIQPQILRRRLNKRKERRKRLREKLSYENKMFHNCEENEDLNNCGNLLNPRKLEVEDEELVNRNQIIEEVERRVEHFYLPSPQFDNNNLHCIWGNQNSEGKTTNHSNFEGNKIVSTKDQCFKRLQRIPVGKYHSDSNILEKPHPKNESSMLRRHFSHNSYLNVDPLRYNTLWKNHELLGSKVASNPTHNFFEDSQLGSFVLDDGLNNINTDLNFSTCRLRECDNHSLQPYLKIGYSGALKEHFQPAEIKEQNENQERVRDYKKFTGDPNNLQGNLFKKPKLYEDSKYNNKVNHEEADDRRRRCPSRNNFKFQHGTYNKLLQSSAMLKNRYTVEPVTTPRYQTLPTELPDGFKQAQKNEESIGERRCKYQLGNKAKIQDETSNSALGLNNKSWDNLEPKNLLQSSDLLKYRYNIEPGVTPRERVLHPDGFKTAKDCMFDDLMVQEEAMELTSEKPRLKHPEYRSYVTLDDVKPFNGYCTKQQENMFKKPKLYEDSKYNSKVNQEEADDRRPRCPTRNNFKFQQRTYNKLLQNSDMLKYRYIAEPAATSTYQTLHTELPDGFKRAQNNEKSIGERRCKYQLENKAKIQDETSNSTLGLNNESWDNLEPKNLLQSSDLLKYRYNIEPGVTPRERVLHPDAKDCRNHDFRSTKRIDCNEKSTGYDFQKMLGEDYPHYHDKPLVGGSESFRTFDDLMVQEEARELTIEKPRLKHPEYRSYLTLDNVKPFNGYCTKLEEIADKLEERNNKTHVKKDINKKQTFAMSNLKMRTSLTDMERFRHQDGREELDFEDRPTPCNLKENHLKRQFYTGSKETIERNQNNDAEHNLKIQKQVRFEKRLRRQYGSEEQDHDSYLWPCNQEGLFENFKEFEVIPNDLEDNYEESNKGLVFGNYKENTKKVRFVNNCLFQDPHNLKEKLFFESGLNMSKEKFPTEFEEQLPNYLEMSFRNNQENSKELSAKYKLNKEEEAMKCQLKNKNRFKHQEESDDNLDPCNTRENTLLKRQFFEETFPIHKSRQVDSREKQSYRNTPCLPNQLYRGNRNNDEQSLILSPIDFQEPINETKHSEVSFSTRTCEDEALSSQIDDYVLNIKKGENDRKATKPSKINVLSEIIFPVKTSNITNPLAKENTPKIAGFELDQTRIPAEEIRTAKIDSKHESKWVSNIERQYFQDCSFLQNPPRTNRDSRNRFKDDAVSEDLFSQNSKNITQRLNDCSKLSQNNDLSVLEIRKDHRKEQLKLKNSENILSYSCSQELNENLGHLKDFLMSSQIIESGMSMHNKVANKIGNQKIIIAANHNKQLRKTSSKLFEQNSSLKAEGITDNRRSDFHEIQANAELSFPFPKQTAKCHLQDVVQNEHDFKKNETKSCKQVTSLLANKSSHSPKEENTVENQISCTWNPTMENITKTTDNKARKLGNSGVEHLRKTSTNLLDQTLQKKPVSKTKQSSLKISDVTDIFNQSFAERNLQNHKEPLKHADSDNRNLFDITEASLASNLNEPIFSKNCSHADLDEAIRNDEQLKLFESGFRCNELRKSDTSFSGDLNITNFSERINNILEDELRNIEETTNDHANPNLSCEFFHCPSPNTSNRIGDFEIDDPRFRKNDGNVKEFVEDEENQNIRIDGVTYHLNSKTGMITNKEQKQDGGFCFKERNNFVPKGCSPLLSGHKILPKVLDSPTREYLYKTVLENLLSDLDTVKWKKIIAKPDRTEIFKFLCNEKLNNNVKVMSIMDVTTGIRSKATSKSLEKDILEDIEVVGQMDKKFIVAVTGNDEQVIIFDQHAVHERIRLEKILKGYCTFSDGQMKYINKQISKSMCIEMDNSILDYIENNKRLFEEMNLTFTIAKTHLEFRVVPACLYDKAKKVGHFNESLRAFIVCLLDQTLEIIQNNRGVILTLPEFVQTVINSEACRGAVMFGDELSLDFCQELIADLSKTNLPFQCAHGRPTLAPIIGLAMESVRMPKTKPNLKSLLSKR